MDIEGLTFHLWKQEVFEKIGQQYGGLVTVNRQTKSLAYLREARIKVKKGEHGFIPTFFDVEENGSKWKVKLRVIRKRKDNSYLSSSDGKVEEGKKIVDSYTWQQGKAKCI